MVDRPILRFPDPVPSGRRTGAARSQPRPRGPGLGGQGRRFQATFDGLATAFATDNPGFILREDPVGIAPERALVFVTAGNVQHFSRAARAIGLEVFAETELEEIEDIPEGFEAPGEDTALARTLYATMPTLDSLRRILSLWNAHQAGSQAPTGAAPWWTVFDLLLELRRWGPDDRLGETARAVLLDRLPMDDTEEVSIELEIWPTTSAEKRIAWRRDTERRIADLGGHVVDQSSIVENGFIYEAVLAALPGAAVKAMLDNPGDADGLATLEGVQFILPQMIGQAEPSDTEGEVVEHQTNGNFVADAPIRAALFDGTPMAGHSALDNGVVIEDIHDLVRLSAVDQRFHATAMASLILRGDLEADGVPLQDTRLVSVPLLTDDENGSWTPSNKLFVDLLHTALMQLLLAEEPLAPEVFVVNFSIGVPDLRFSGRISSLARLMDWWAAKEGVLFVVSAGNIGDRLSLAGVSTSEFEDGSGEERREIVREAIRHASYERTLLSPAEALNVLTVGAVSKDLNGNNPPDQAGILSMEEDGETLPQITSALGLGPHRSIKPDILESGGRVEVRALPEGDDASLRALQVSQRTGLIAASPRGIQKSRGTSPATALSTRAILRSAEALTGEEGPYEGQELPRRTLALLTRALAVNAARWPNDARELYDNEIERLGQFQHARAKEEVCRHFGHGVVDANLMWQSPDAGVTLVGYGTIRKDEARIFKMPLPPSMSGDRVPRSMRVTLSWFSPVNPARAQYRLAGLEAVVADGQNYDEDKGWGLDLKSDGPDSNMVKRGSIWSRRLVNRIKTVPEFEADAEIPICVQCRDTAGGGLSPDDDIEFAIAVTLEVEAEVQYDVLEEVEEQVRLRLRRGA